MLDDRRSDSFRKCRDDALSTFYLLCYFSNNRVMIYELGGSLGIILLFVMEDIDFRKIEKESFVISDKVWREIIRISYLF